MKVPIKTSAPIKLGWHFHVAAALFVPAEIVCPQPG